MGLRLLWQQIPSTMISELYCQANKFDGVVLDTEHSPFNNETLFNCIQVVRLYDKECFVRVSHLDKVLVKMCMDAGVTGMIFSTIETGKQVKEILTYCRYPKQGGKRGQGLNRENHWGRKSLGTHKPILVGQIETKNAVDGLKKLKGFDYYMIGPYDLSASLGCVGDFEKRTFREYIGKIHGQIPKKKLGIHIPNNVDEHINKYKDYEFVAMGMDTTLLIEKLNELGELI